MRKNIVLVALISFMFVFSLQIAQPVSAAKLKVVDKGSITLTDPYEGKFTYSWKTYQKGTSYVKMVVNMYSQKYGYGTSMTYYFQKVNKKKLKISMSTKGYKGTLGYEYTKLTAARYYWRVFRPEMIAGLKSLS